MEEEVEAVLLKMEQPVDLVVVAVDLLQLLQVQVVLVQVDQEILLL